jgi:hypothetical protein
MIIYWEDGTAYTAAGQVIDQMTLEEAAMLAGKASEAKPGDMVFVRLGLPPGR